MPRSRFAIDWRCLSLGALLAAIMGCQQLGAFIAVMKGGETIKAEFTGLTKGPLAIVLDDPEQFGLPADVYEAFHEKITKVFAEHEVNTRVVPFEDVQRVRQDDTKFDQMSLREIGEAVGAEQIIYVKITRWALREEPGDPYFRGTCNVGVKVCSTERKKDVKLWPTDRDYTPAQAQTDRQATDAGGAEAMVSRMLAEKTAVAVAEIFHDHKANRRFE